MKYLAIIFVLGFSPLTKAGPPLSLVEESDNIVGVLTTEEVWKVKYDGDCRGEDIMMVCLENCEDQPGRRCVHFTQCHQDGFVGEDYSQVIDVR